MPQLNPVVLKDYAAADHTFNPRDVVAGVATLTESPSGIPLGERRLSIAVSATQTGKRKVTMKLVLPVVQDGTVNGVAKPTLVRTAYADLVFTFDSASTTAERNDALGLVWSLLGSPIAQDVVGDLQAMY